MIDIALVTWPNHPKRFEYFKRTVEALQQHLKYAGCIQWVCSAETEQDPNYAWMGEVLHNFCLEHHIRLRWRQAKPNLGANMNAALRLCKSPCVLIVQDDWVIQRSLDVTPGVELLADNSKVDMIRYAYPDNDRQRPTFRKRSDGWFKIDHSSTWLYGDEPHLQRVDFVRKWGYYLEGGPHASASQALMHKLRNGGATMVCDGTNYFKHIGQISAYPNESRPGRDRKRLS